MRQRHRVVDGRLDRPAALAGVRRVTLERFEVLVLVQRVDRQVQQPGTDDRALLPGPEDLTDVGDRVHRLQQLPALGVRLHHRVLDAVVNHLREVARADLARVDRAELAHRLEGVEDRLHLLDVLGLAAVHQRIAVLQAPDAAGDTAVDEADALGLQLRRVLLVIRPARVAAVHHDITGGEQLAELVDGRLGGRAGRDHHPHDPWRSQLVHKLTEAVDIGEIRVAVVADDRVAGLADAQAHVAAHLAETDETELHR